VAEAERWLLDALARAQGGEVLPDGRDSRRLLVQSLIDLGSFYADHGSPPVADRLLVRALKRVDADPVLGPHSPAAALVCTKLAELRCRPRGVESAEPLARRALEIRRRHPEFGPDHPQTARSASTLARVLVRRGALDEAEALFQKALGIYQRHPPAPQHDACAALHGLGDIYLARADGERGLEMHLKALEARQAVLPPDHADLLESFRSLAACYMRLDRQNDAVRLYERVLAAREKDTAGGDLRLSQALFDLAGACALSDPSRGRELLLRALALQESNFGPEHPALVGSLVKLAEVTASLKQWDLVVALRRRILQLRERELGQDHPQVLKALTELCQACCRAGRWDDADALDQRALYLCEKNLGFEHPKVARVLLHYAEVLRQLGRDRRAAQITQRAAAIARKDEPDHPNGPIEHTDGPTG
jgi:tetratricopeptide (TPR) repeat protein